MNQNQKYLSLNWSKEDPENKIGLFRAGQYTAVSNGLSLVAGILFAGLFFALAFFAIKPLAQNAAWLKTFVNPITRPQNMVVVVPIVFFFFWCIVTLFIKGRKIIFQSRALGLATVPQQVDWVLNESSAQSVLQRMRELVDSPKHFVLLNRVNRAISNLQNVGGVSDVSSILTTQAENDENQASSSYIRIQGFVWAIPVLGFIGTVIGLSKAIGKFADTVKGSGELEQIKDSLTEVTGGLSTAFETTLIALVAALLIQLYLTSMQSRENKFLDDCNEYCHSQVISKLRVIRAVQQPAARPVATAAAQPAQPPQNPGAGGHPAGSAG